MAKCDFCGGQCSAYELQPLRPTFQFDGVVDVCPACARMVNKVKDDIFDTLAPQTREELRRRRKAMQGGPAPSATRRVLGRWFPSLYKLIDKPETSS